MALKYFEYSLNINKNQTTIINYTAYLKTQNRNYKEAIELYNYLLLTTKNINSYKVYLHNIAASYTEIG